MHAGIDQPTLFDVEPTEFRLTAPFVASSETSREAAEAIAPHLNRLQLRVLALFGDAGAAGLTDWEIECRGALNPSTVRPRRGELASAGCIRKTDRRRSTGSGRDAAVWVITEAGREWLEGAE